MPSKIIVAGSETKEKVSSPFMTTAMAPRVRKDTDTKKAIEQILDSFFIWATIGVFPNQPAGFLSVQICTVIMVSQLSQLYMQIS